MANKFLKGTSGYVWILFTQHSDYILLLYSAYKSRFVAKLSIATPSKWKLYYPMNCYPRNANQLCEHCIPVCSHLLTRARSTKFCHQYFFLSHLCIRFTLILYITHILLHLMIEVGEFFFQFLNQSFYVFHNWTILLKRKAKEWEEN